MTDIRRISLTAIVLLVALRLAVGWQLLYEGLWKIDTLSGARPWTSEGYLKNAVGPLRSTFRAMSGDPNDLGWLDYDTVVARWNEWADRFRAHYKLDDTQAKKLRYLLEGTQQKVTVEVDGKDQSYLAFSEPLKTLPEGITEDRLAKTVSSNVFEYSPAVKKLFIYTNKSKRSGYLTPADVAKLKSLVSGRTDADSNAFRTAVDKVYDRQKKGLGFQKKLAGALKGDTTLQGNEAWQRVGQLEQYQKQLAEYERDRAAATTDFQRDHLDHTWTELQALRAEITGPIKAMESELKESATALLTIEQMKLGSVPEPWTVLRFTDTMTIVGLTALGTMLITGLFTRFAAAAAAFMLFNFYMAMPPWPGVPELPGPEHSFIVNKNLIEVIALIAFAALPSGRWFGLDGLMRYWFEWRRADSRIHAPRTSTVEAPSAS